MNELTPDWYLVLDGFQLMRVDKCGKDSSKRKSGGIAMFVSNSFCVTFL